MSSSSKAVSLAFTVGAESVGTGGAFTCSHKSMMLAAVAIFAATMKAMARVGNRTRMMSLLSIKFSQWTSVYTRNATCVIQPGGSMRDQEVIDAADERGVTMVFS